MKDGLNILVVEDELIVGEEIREYLTQAGYNVIDAVPSSNEAINILKSHKADLALLDINIKGDMDGIELGKYIRKTNNCPIIYLTAYSDEGTLRRAKDVHPEAYLVKPFEPNNLRVSIDLAVENFTEHKNTSLPQTVMDSVFLKENERHVRVMVEDILFIEAQGSYCSVITKAKTYIYSFNMKTAIEKIVHPDLLKAHRSHIVNIKNVDALEGNQLMLGKHKVQMSASHRDDILKHLNIV